MALVAGFGVADITPPTPVALAGFGEPQPANEVHDPLQARALYLHGEGGTLCLVVCDLLGMSYRFGHPARAAVAEALQVPVAAVLLACTHTHSGPSAMEGTEAMGWPNPEGFAATIEKGCVAAATAARDAARAARVRWHRDRLPDGLSINRRGYPYDPWFSVLDVVGDDGRRVGSLSNLSIHPVALGPECLAVSADWVAPFRDAVEAELGGTAMMLSGALGDVNPAHVHRQHNDCRADGFEEAARIGAGAADAVAAGTRAAIELRDATAGVVAQRHLDVPTGGTRLAAGRGGRPLQVELVEWSIGPVRLVSIPGEAFQELGRQVSASRGDQAILAGLAPLWFGYLPVPYVDGGYEESVSYGPPAVDAITAALLEVPTA